MILYRQWLEKSSAITKTCTLAIAVPSLLPFPQIDKLEWLSPTGAFSEATSIFSSDISV